MQKPLGGTELHLFEQLKDNMAGMSWREIMSGK